MQNLHRLLPSLQVRGQLKLKERKLSDKTLKAVWRALDADGSDRLSVGEFGAFMRLHEFESGAEDKAAASPQATPRSADASPQSTVESSEADVKADELVEW